MSCAFEVEYGKLIELLNKGTERLVGEIMPVLEAVISADRQADATKSIVKKAIWSFNRELKSCIEEITTSKEED